MATKHTLSIYRGEDVTIPWDVDEDITGWTVELVLSDQVMDATPTLTVSASITTAATGLCEVVLTASQTGALASRVYHSEMCRTNAGAANVLSQGTITVLPRVGVA